MRIRKYKNKDVVEVANLITKTFSKFNSKEGSKKAVKQYIDKYDVKKNIEKINKNFKKTPLFFVATENN